MLQDRAGSVSIRTEHCRPAQHHSSFCTVIFILAPNRRLMQLQPEALKTSAGRRSYSWRSEDGPHRWRSEDGPHLRIRRNYSWRSEDHPHLNRSRTAYYDILRVSPNATQAQIKTAYYKQSFIHHPDKNPDSKEATQRFSQISEAYTVLGNVSLRRKYDRGILSQTDVQSAGRPSSKVSSSPGSSQQQQKQHQRARQFSQTGGRPMFDFDAFYQAHYGDQLQRERELRARKQHLQEMLKKEQSKWREQRIIELTCTVLIAMGCLIMVSLSKD